MARVVRHGSLRSKVYLQLREQILSGAYKRGNALIEAQIAQEMGVSRTPIREALCQLELDGLVMTTPNKSVLVQGFDEQDILDLYEVRGHMETLAAARAAIQMTEDQRNRLQDAYRQEVENTQDNDEIEVLQNLDNQFHDLIFEGSGSKVLQKILRSINTYTRHARSISLATPGRSEQVLHEHFLIMDAILSRNSEQAYECMRSHLNRALNSFQAISRKRRENR